LWEDNPVVVQILGICSSLAVTNLVKNTLVMCLGLIFATAMSAWTVSLLRNLMPRKVRMITQVLIIAAWVIVIKIILDAFLPAISKDLGPYVGLIITNCIVMGRTEAFAMANRPWASFLDGIGAGVGYSLVLLTIAVFREPLGLGTLFGFQVIPDGWTRWNMMVIAPSGFFCLATFIWVARAMKAPAPGAAPVKK
ncbi:MAG TPA: NADH:ubiquinone reductase (Na(+)-transporting) subunit D, partial [Candidatus Ozemobacteraceae bacterium]|nr:NADH:ubiquinone reductase (Na(+)-transporting) subunit D [Candidatus Ozemobacteraceae bacterium]